MCGIVGYIGKQDASNIVLSGLKRLEYRGYDSYGICFIEKDKHHLFKRVGKIEKTEQDFLNKNFKGSVCIAHNRWATTGLVNEENAHPHCDCKEEIFVVHNGIVENYKELKEKLIKEGHKFSSETDTEVIAHLIEKYYKDNLENAVKRALDDIRGTYGLVVASVKEPDKIVVARMSSPLIIGVGDNEFLVASDPSAIISRTRQIINLDDGEIAVLEVNNIRIYKEEKESKKDIQIIDWDIELAEKDGHEHFMLKEIMEEPNVIEDAMRGRLLDDMGMVKLGGLEGVENKLREINSLSLVGCGTAYYACRVGKYMIEEYADIPVEVDFGSEFRYKKPIIKKDGGILFVSQSGETADTLSCLKEMKEKGALTLGITNVVGSSQARETDAGVYTRSGPEISVASTKAFLGQLTVLVLVTIYLGRQRNMSMVMGKRIIDELKRIPELAKKILKQKEEIEKIAQKYKEYKNFWFIGRK